MGFFDFLRGQPTPASPPEPSAPAPAPAITPDTEHIYSVPLAARKFTTSGAVPKEVYMFYAFLFADSAKAAVAKVRKEVRDEGYEFIELTGQVVYTTLPEWSRYVETHLDWIKDSVPTTENLRNVSRGIVHYSPKIMRL
jgi:hypothetical protein